MQQAFKKRGQRFLRKFSRFSKKAGEDAGEHIQENLIERLEHAKNVRLLILEWSLLVTAIIFLAITQAFWYAESYADDAFTSGGTYTEATLGKINSLNPLFATTSSEKTLSKLMFATLSTPDYSGHTGPGLAASITADESGKIWTIKLRDNLKWSDGEPIENADILYTVRMVQDPKINTSYSSNLSGVKVSEDDDSVIFELPAAYANFPTALNFPILPSHLLKDVPAEHLLESSFSSSPVTSGAFSYNATQAIGTEGEKLVYLTASDSYYKGRPLLDSFTVHAFMNTDDIKAALQSGSVTATAELSSVDAAEVKSSSVLERETALSSGVFAFMNTQSPLLANQSLRKAIQQGLDLRSLRAEAGDEIALDYPILDTQIDLDEFPSLPDYDPDAAKATVAEQLPEGLELTIATVDTGYLPDLADNLEYQLQGLGFKVNKRVLEPGQDFLMGVIRPRAYDILIYEVELGPDPDLFPYYHSSQATSTGLNLSNYNNKLADALILGGRSTMNPDIRLARYQTFLRYWVEDVPAIGIYQTNLTYYYNKNVRSFSEDNRLVYATDRFSDITSWAAEKTTKNRTP